MPKESDKPIDTYTLSPDGRSITCRRCQRTSYNSKDIEQHYCGHCHMCHDDIYPPARQCWIETPPPPHYDPKDPRRNELGKRLMPGFWVDKAGHLHVSLPELLALFDLPDTPENRAIAERYAREALEKFQPGHPIVYRRTPDE